MCLSLTLLSVFGFISESPTMGTLILVVILNGNNSENTFLFRFVKRGL